MFQPQLGTFLSRDPLPQAGQPDIFSDNNWFGRWLDLMKNQYGYGFQNPVRFADPSGLAPYSSPYNLPQPGWLDPGTFTRGAYEQQLGGLGPTDTSFLNFGCVGLCALRQSQTFNATKKGQECDSPGLSDTGGGDVYAADAGA